MNTRKQMIVLAATFVAALALPPALHANDSHGSSGSTRKDGMMGGGSTMGCTSRMMEGCDAMMQADTAAGRTTSGAKLGLNRTATVEHDCRKPSSRLEQFLALEMANAIASDEPRNSFEGATPPHESPQGRQCPLNVSL